MKEVSYTLTQEEFDKIENGDLNLLNMIEFELLCDANDGDEIIIWAPNNEVYASYVKERNEYHDYS